MSKKLKKTTGLLLATAMITSVLSGCMATDSAVQINEDGTGKFVLRAGISENGIKAMQSDENATFTMDEDGEWFAINGVQYYGDTQTVLFKDLDELNALFKGEDDEDAQFSDGENEYWNEQEETTLNTVTGSDLSSSYGDVEVTKTAGGYEINIDMTELRNLYEAQDENAVPTSNIPEELMDEMSISLSFELPWAVKQTAGTKTGVYFIGKNTVSIDYMDLYNAFSAHQISAYDAKLKFAAEKESTGSEADVETPVVIPYPYIIAPVLTVEFPDVPTNMWCHAAVQAMQSKGWVEGYSSGNFGPNDKMTIPQFCTVLCRALDLPTGEGPDDGWWATIAVMNCVNAGYISNRGAVTENNYNKPITRQEAIAALQRAGRFQNKRTSLITAKDIPDSAKIDKAFLNDIVDAYNSGVTNGYDKTLRFEPMRTLTRGHVCQMFYNAFSA